MSRNTTLVLKELPAKTLHDMLGMAVATATSGAHDLGAPRASYALKVSRR